MYLGDGVEWKWDSSFSKYNWQINEVLEQMKISWCFGEGSMACQRAL